jgi:phosphatidylserine/phosphatidylglycerophosphate/cardiolipin synthase-like enzyme
MFGIFRKERESYSGRDAYKYVEPLIRKAKELYIISPYIDLYYAKFLLSNRGGKKIYIISSSIDQGAMKLFAGKRDRLSLLAYIVLIAALDYAAAMLGFYLSYVLIGSGIAIAAIAYMLSAPKKIKGLNVKVPSSFVHAKMYVSDSAAIEGSANLTYKGMHRNVERITVVRSKDEVEKMRKEFFALWNSL